MRKVWITLIAAFVLALTPQYAFAEEEAEKFDITTMSASELTAYQKMLQKKKEAVSKSNVITPDKIDKYVQIGEAFGRAFKGCWSTVSDDAERFANSDAGKIAMFLVAWKIMGEDAVSLTKNLVRWAIGAALLFIGLITWIVFFRKRWYPITEIERTGFFKYKKTYGEQESYYDSQILWVIALFGWVLACTLVAFAG